MVEISGQRSSGLVKGRIIISDWDHETNLCCWFWAPRRFAFASLLFQVPSGLVLNMRLLCVFVFAGLPMVLVVLSLGSFVISL